MTANRLARWFMDAAVGIAPRSRSEWARAMRGEFEAMDEEPAAPGWAAQCLLTSIGWRLRVELPLCLALLATAVAWRFLVLALLVAAGHVGEKNWFPLMGAGGAGGAVLLGSLTFGLCLFRPRRLVFTTMAVVVLTIGIGFFGFLAALLSHPFEWQDNQPQLPSWVLTLWFVVDQVWPAVAGAAAVSALTRWTSWGRAWLARQD